MFPPYPSGADSSPARKHVGKKPTPSKLNTLTVVWSFLEGFFVIFGVPYGMLSQRRPRGGPKACPRCPKGVPRRAQGVPKASQRRPKASQSVPKVSKGVPRRPKASPRRPKDVPKASQRHAKAFERRPKVMRCCRLGGNSYGGRRPPSGPTPMDFAKKTGVKKLTTVSQFGYFGNIFCHF